jgi:hypothetical protein
MLRCDPRFFSRFFSAPPVAEITRSGNNHITEVKFAANTHDPLISIAPPLHYDYDLIFDTCKGKLTIAGNVKWFPSYDLIVNGSTEVNYSAVGKNPAILYLLAGPIPAISPIPIKKFP